ncbi:MAG TPA: LysM peptidoglycan-binding domain-containing M23 family metallopeptidase [bacterium]|nr:LysM peptidoglycan-binding domain-containing M23 family metallopeptidase [bacterium]
MTDVPPQVSPTGRRESLKSESQRLTYPAEQPTSFKNVLAETGTGKSEPSGSHIVQVREGDTLSEIVNRALKKRNMPHNTQDLYHWVESVAHANGLANPDLIYAGQRLDLSILHGQPQPEPVAVSDSVPEPETAFLTPVSGEITSGFGMRIHPLDHVPHFHYGLDIAAPAGTPVSATGAGVVAFAGQRGGYGNCVDIDHGNGWLTRYAHLERVLVGVGQEITGGDRIGNVGSTGRTTGPHLHLEIHQNGRRINPLSMVSIEGPGPAIRIAASRIPEEETS